MDHSIERRLQLPGEPTSPAVARRFVRSALQEAELDELADDALLLTSELCENAVLHAGTGFELTLTADGDELTVGITDHGSTAMELRRGGPSARRSTHNRGLRLVDAVATAWGSRHDADGHQVWFSLRQEPAPEGPPVPPLGELATGPWPDPAIARWLLYVPERTSAQLSLAELVAELVRRLCDVLGAAGGEVLVDDGISDSGGGADGDGDDRNWLASSGRTDGEALTVALPLYPSRGGRLLLFGVSDVRRAAELAELTAQRIALAVEIDRLHRAEGDRWAWMTLLAEASALLGHSLDVGHTAAIVPQLIVPRLGAWSAVHLLDARGQFQLAALSHADEAELAQLKADLHPGAGAVHDRLRRLLAGVAETADLAAPVAGVAVPLRAGQRTLGTLSVGRPSGRAHRPEELMMISELARRAVQAIDNAQRNTAAVTTSQALQQALLPRALPAVSGVQFAAAYLPASAGVDVCGDFYDVVAVDQDRWFAAVGDVCGKGPVAAARTGLVRDVLRVLIREGQPLIRAVELLNDLMLEAAGPDQFATVALALVSRSPRGTGELTVDLVLAGHERPALLLADGTVSLVGEHGRPVGLVEEFIAHPTRHVLAPGDALVFYTDGIIERRRAGEEFGQERLTTTIAGSTHDSAERLVSRLQRTVHDFSPEPQHDDIVIMVVRVPEAET
ncbi:MAG: SpoIIE family protein phosphatase [Labedaea sp.]